MIMQEAMDSTIQQLSEAQQVCIRSGLALENGT